VRLRIAAGLLAGGLATACAPSGPGPFEAERHRDHPLVGAVVSGARGEVDRGALRARALAARFVLLGETHDNPAHHRLQARLVAQLAAEWPRPPAVVLEMLDPEDQPAIDAFRAAGRRDPDAFAARVGWAESGWPDFALYRPLFRAVLDAGLPILAAGLPRDELLAPDAPERAPRFGLGEPLPPPERAARLDELYAAHCELVPRDALAPMLERQRERDVRLARLLLRGARAQGRAVLVAGNGHVRESGVPAVLARAGVEPGAILSVGLLEVEPGRTRVEATEAGRFDLAVFTPAAAREDPCERLRRRLEAPRASRAASP